MLTVTSLLLRSAGVFFSARLSIIAGNAVMGLYTQIMNVYAFAVTASAAGINLGAVRVISECYGSGRTDSIRSSVRSCTAYCLKAGLLVSIIMFILAPFLGCSLIGDSRTVPSLRALSFALPFIALSNALHGYFNGVKKISRSAFTSLFEQFIRIASTLIALSFFADSSTEMLCLILVICNASSEALSFLILYIFYTLDKKNYPIGKANIYFKKRFLSITVPIAISALIRSALTTAEHLIIPVGLRASGLDGESALAQYGIVSGMALPILLYPMALLTSFASITISELSARVSAKESKESIKKTVTKGLVFALIYGIGCSALVGCFADKLAISIYKSNEAGHYLKILAPLVFFMYLDHISDGMLKGLDKQNYVMRVNIIDAFLSVIFAIILIPKFGIYGFIASLYLCECLNCFFSFGRLFLMIKPKINVFLHFIMPLACSITVSGICTQGNAIPLFVLMLVSIIIYAILLMITGALQVFKHQTST